MSKKFIEGEYTPEQIKSMLANHCESSEETKYYRDLSEQDLVEKHQELSKNLIKLNELDEELKDIKDDYKTRMKPMVTLQKDLLEAIGIKKELVDGTLYHIANQVDGMMETYTSEGELHSSRRLRPDERQARLFIDKAVGE
jgi:heat shock protein HspQ